MTDSRRYGLTPQLDIGKILLDAQNRWLRPTEVCEILRNYKLSPIYSEKGMFLEFNAISLPQYHLFSLQRKKELLTPQAV